MDTSRRLLLALVVLASACSSVGDELAGLRGRAGDAADRVQFCFAVTRALTAVDGGSSPAEAQAAAEEVLTQVPDDLRPDAEFVAERLRQAAESGDTSVLDEEFRAAATSLREDTQELCDPRS